MILIETGSSRWVPNQTQESLTSEVGRALWFGIARRQSEGKEGPAKRIDAGGQAPL